MKAMIFDIQRNSYVDGPGIRTTVFFKGCNLRCAWCHNPESQSPKPQMMFYKNKCTGCEKCREKCPNSLKKCDLCGKCALYCPNNAREICGKEYTVDEVLGEVIKDKSFYENSGGGVTFSGGECMLQVEFLAKLLRLCKQYGIHTAVDTAGCVPYASFEKILPDTDLFLYDCKCFDEQTHKVYTGVGNALILENLARLLQSGKPIWIRIPIIPEVNDTEEEMQRIKAFLDKHGKAARVELLPYHAMGEHKYAAMGKDLQRFTPPTDARIAELQKIFEE